MKTLRHGHVGFWGGLMIFALLLWFTVPVAFAELPQVVKESFNYAEGTLGGLGDDAVGWGGPWEELSTGYAEVVAEPLPFTIIPATGNVLQVFEGGTTFRNLSETWPDDGSTYWYSQLYQRFDGIDVDASYNGLSLFMDASELLYIGKPWATKNMGIEGSGVGMDTASVDAYDGGWMVVQLIMSGDAENDDAYLWINPDPAVQPDTANADAHVKWHGSAGFNRVRIGSGDLPNQAECTYDEIRLSQTYAGLTSDGSGLPAPVSFYDFEETEGVVVLDQGTAANNGEIVDDYGYLSRNTGGIYAKEADGRGCLQWTEENGFGSLCYVLVPYKDFMNSPNYTFSAWIQYVGAPTWGYIFWMGGDTWPEDPMERHVDVWLNPNGGGGGVDCILNDVDGGQPRVATLEADCGIGVMDGDWHLVSVTLKDGVSIKIYLDGLLAAETEAAAAIVENSGDDLYLGARPNDADALTSVKIIGMMDRVRIWDVALDEAQNELLFNMEGPSGGTVGVKEQPTTPQTFGLLSNYPNPFNPVTTISYTLDRAEKVALEIYNVLGTKVRTLYSGVQNAGTHAVQWDAAGDDGKTVPSGLYIYRLTAGERATSGKMMLMK
jgi:hypothetical protein